MVFGIVLIVAGVLTAGGITAWALWANNKLGGGVWTSAKSLPLIIAFWAGGTAMLIGGIYMMTTDHPQPHHAGKHSRARIAIEARHTMRG
jgi:hypothetical protein